MSRSWVFASISTLLGKEIAPGVKLKPLAGEHVMMGYIEMAPHSEVQLHSHPHEQLGMMFEGELELLIGNERRTIRPGDIWLIPSGVPHGASVGALGARTLDVFYPVREDYMKLFKEND